MKEGIVSFLNGGNMALLIGGVIRIPFYLDEVT